MHVNQQSLGTIVTRSVSEEFLDRKQSRVRSSLTCRVTIYEKSQLQKPWARFTPACLADGCGLDNKCAIHDPLVGALILLLVSEQFSETAYRTQSPHLDCAL